VAGWEQGVGGRRLLLLPSPPLFRPVVRALDPQFLLSGSGAHGRRTPCSNTPVLHPRDLSGELAASVLDLGRQVPGLPPILPFVLREIGGVTMAGNFRIRKVLIRPLYSLSALGRQASPVHRHGQICYLVLEPLQPRRQFSRATLLGRPTADMGLDVSFDLWTSLCPVLRGRGGRFSIQKVSDRRQCREDRPLEAR
jgi:hypothetical protein